MFVAYELHISAERQPPDLPARATLVGPTRDLTTESDRKGLRADTEPAGHEVMAQFVDKHERAEGANERQEDQPDWRFAKASGAAFLDGLGHASAHVPVDFKHIFDGLRSRPVILLKRAFNKPRDIRKPDAAFQEGGDRDPHWRR
jgi:hypothetical protein